ncbi:MAG: 6,7-dimethyl-8-ribityllumazine synthase [Acidimicrobiaceae bacterium]|nr:6,7-dimethyl-8-ribityllumazine synthase [Acidimicrobiaceae bacterium]
MTSSDETHFRPEYPGELTSRVGRVITSDRWGTGRRVGVVCASFNGGVTERLLEGALGAFEECGVARSDITLLWVPGAFEAPLGAKHLVDAGLDAVVTLGAVIRGDTGHYEVVANECARGVQQVQLETGVPVVFGVLTVNTVEQALERSRPDDTNKGRESALTALDMISVISQVAR